MHRHFIIHKPVGFVSQFVNNKTRKKRLLSELFDFPEGTMAIGRLDVKSEGLLLLTTDGKLSHTICSQKVDKEYYVQVDGAISDTALEALQNGVSISVKGVQYITRPSKAFKLEKKPDFDPPTFKIRDDRHGPTTWITITINEGKYRQVRKMTAAVGFPTLRLVRVRIGNIALSDLKNGNVIETPCLNY